ncbi:MAG: hypothetical protein L3J78_04760 [Thermoplasmata archaeon]|nr:hypothetical protein [Thermoplasmata archaeon]
MMQGYASTLFAEGVRSRRHAEIAAYVRHEYGAGTGPEFLLAEVANGGAWGPRRRRLAEAAEALSVIAKAMKAFVGGADRKAKVADAAR